MPYAMISEDLIPLEDEPRYIEIMQRLNLLEE